MPTSIQSIVAMRERFVALKVLLNSYIGADCQPALNDLSDSEKQALQEEYRALRKKLANR